MRQRVDGHKFEDEFEKAFKTEGILLRLHTPSAKYSGITQPADFIFIANGTSYVETKETGGDAFSISAMDQLDEIIKYLHTKHIDCNAKQAVIGSNYYIVVHFITHKVIKVITAEYAMELLDSRKRLSYTDMNGYTFKTLEEMKESNIF